MTTTMLDEPATTTSEDHGQRLQSRMAAARLSFTWLGVRKTLTAAQKSQAADSFGAEGKFLSADKKLLDTRHPAFTKTPGKVVITTFLGVCAALPKRAGSRN